MEAQANLKNSASYTERHTLSTTTMWQKRKSWLKILGITLKDNPCNWDIQMHELISKARSRMYIMRVCKHYGLSKKQLDLLFNSLIMPIIIYGIELWGCAYYDKYLSQTDSFFGRAYKYGYTCKRMSIKEVINIRDRKL